LPLLKFQPSYESNTYGAANTWRSALVSREWKLFSEIIFVVRIIHTQAQRLWLKYRDSDAILDIISLPLNELHLTPHKSPLEQHKVCNTFKRIMNFKHLLSGR